MCSYVRRAEAKRILPEVLAALIGNRESCLATRRKRLQSVSAESSQPDASATRLDQHRIIGDIGGEFVIVAVVVLPDGCRTFEVGIEGTTVHICCGSVQIALVVLENRPEAAAGKNLVTALAAIRRIPDRVPLYCTPIQLADDNSVFADVMNPVFIEHHMSEFDGIPPLGTRIDTSRTLGKYAGAVDGMNIAALHQKVVESSSMGAIGNFKTNPCGIFPCVVIRADG